MDSFSQILESKTLDAAAKEIIKLQKAEKEAYVAAFKKTIEDSIEQLLQCELDKKKYLHSIIIVSLLTNILLIFVILSLVI